MRNSAAFPRKFDLPKHPCALFFAALVAFGAILPGAGAQIDLPALNMRADLGDPEALNTLGNIYANGQGGVTQDYAQALR